MLKTATKEQILKIIFRHIAEDNCVVFVYGSFAQNRPYPSSDIDIGIISDQPLSNSVLVRIKEELQDVKTLRDIEIVDFLSVQDEDFLKTALREVEVWHQTKNSKVYLDNLRERIKS